MVFVAQPAKKRKVGLGTKRPGCQSMGGEGGVGERPQERRKKRMLVNNIVVSMQRRTFDWPLCHKAPPNDDTRYKSTRSGVEMEISSSTLL